MVFSQKLRTFLIVKYMDSHIFIFKFYLILSMTQSFTSPTHNQPFTDIINLSLKQVYIDTEDNLLKDVRITQTVSSLEIPEKMGKQNEKVEVENQVEKTMRKQGTRYKPEFISSKTINNQVVPSAEDELDSPEWDAFNDISSTTEIAHILRMEHTFQAITQPFLDLARKSKLIRAQHTESFVTVRKGVTGSCGCIYKFWGGGETDATVYQLRRYGRGKQAKLILVQGDQMVFHSFYLALLRLLEQRNLVKISPGARVQMLFDVQSGETYQCAKICNGIQKRLNKRKQVTNQEIASLVSKLKIQSGRLKNIIYRTKDVVDLTALERQIQSLCYKTCDISSLYDQLYANQYHQYRKKRQILLKRYPISKLFDQLDISEHYNQFRRLRSLKEIDQNEQKIPYMLAMKELKKLAQTETPAAGFEAVMVFQQRIRTCYQTYFKNTLRLADMDDYLPLTIFCVLAVDTEENLLGLVKQLLQQLNGVFDCEWEKKTLTDIEAAFDYILTQWKMPK